MTTDLRFTTDEDYGRRWAELVGISPMRFPPPFGPDPRAFWKWQHIPGVGHVADSCSEAEAFALLGVRVRWVHANVPLLPEASS